MLNKTRHLDGFIIEMGGYEHPSQAYHEQKTSTMKRNFQLRQLSCQHDTHATNQQELRASYSNQWARFSRPATIGHIHQDQP